jgi:hypothetical protein
MCQFLPVFWKFWDINYERILRNLGFFNFSGGGGTYCLEVQLHRLALALIVFTFLLECPDVIPHKCNLHTG